MATTTTWLTKGGFVREDSDDELGYDDHPWQWIYQESDTVPNTIHDAETSTGQQTTPSNPRKRKASSASSAPRTITGARMGGFQVDIGDAVFLKSPEAGKDWAGLVCAFSDIDEDGAPEMCAHIMWFCSREELESTGPGTTASSKKARKLPDAMPNESYITADFNMNPLTAINGKATVLGQTAYLTAYPEGGMPKGKAAANKWAKTIVCRRGVKQRNLKFTEPFEWEELYKGPGDLLDLLDWVKEQSKGARRKIEDSDSNADKEAHAATAEDKGMNMETGMEVEPRTPKKKRKTTTTASAASTPKSSVKSSRFTTPTSKRIMIKKPLEFTPLGTRFISPAYQATASPYAHARSTLHVSTVPMSLPCRTAEFDTVYSHLHSAITDGSGSCIYISGTPGTGKTATVREVVSHLLSAVQTDELDDFNFVEINGMKVTEPAQSYSLLWEALKGDRVSPASALGLLEHEFSHPSPRRIPCVVLMDELDQLVTKSQSVMYNFFNWPSLRHSRLIVLAVANTMDLPERTLSNKISSRLGLIRITFPGYTHSQLMEIISSRLQGVEGGIVDGDAIQFAARKVAAVSGDARRALDICRRAVEIAEQQAKELHGRESTNGSIVGDEDSNDDDDDNNNNETNADVVQVGTPSKTGRGNKSTPRQSTTPSDGRTDASPTKMTPKPQPKPQPHVTIATIKAAINEATSNPMSQHLRSLPLSSKLFLAAVLARSRRTGVTEATLGDVLAEAKRIADVDDREVIHDFLLTEAPRFTVTNGSSGADRMTPSSNPGKRLPRVLGMGAAAMELVEAGIISMDVRSRGERAGKVRLRIGEEVVVSAMMGDEEVRGMGFNSS